VPDPASRPRLSRYAAPAAFLLGVTIAVLLIRSGLGGGGGSPGATVGPVTHPATASISTATAPANTRTAAGAQYYTVKHGDTFGSIAAAEGTSVAAIEQLNPGVSSNALQVGQRIRVK
jgi:LysM repeat protein